MTLNLYSNAHAFHNPTNWGGLPDEMKAVVEHILTDRFWQAGISTGSRDDFYAKITASRGTLEGFASSVRGKIRAVREACYSILFSMSRMREHFYGFAELPGPLSEALFNDSVHLSSHQFSVLLNVSRCLIDDCPVRFRSQFLPPMLSNLFTHIDRKVTTEWEIIEQQKAGMAESDLTDEMKSESILRQLTYSAVIMVASLLDPQRGGKLPSPAVTVVFVALANVDWQTLIKQNRRTQVDPRRRHRLLSPFDTLFSLRRKSLNRSCCFVPMPFACVILDAAASLPVLFDPSCRTLRLQMTPLLLPRSVNSSPQRSSRRVSHPYTSPISWICRKTLHRLSRLSGFSTVPAAQPRAQSC